MFRISRLENLLLHAVGAGMRRVPTVAALQPRDLSVARDTLETQISSRANKPRRHARKLTPLRSPGIQHSLERDAVRVKAIPWLS
jgi:hypothetical protein